MQRTAHAQTHMFPLNARGEGGVSIDQHSDVSAT